MTENYEVNFLSNGNMPYSKKKTDSLSTNKIPLDFFTEGVKKLHRSTSANGAGGTIDDSKELLYKVVENEKSRIAKAKKKFDSKKASNGMRYGEAEKTINDIIEKYEKMHKIRDIMDHIVERQPDGKEVTRHVINPDKLPEPDRTNYKKALAARDEIEKKYPEEYKDCHPNGSLTDAISRGMISSFHNL